MTLNVQPPNAAASSLHECISRDLRIIDLRANRRRHNAIPSPESASLRSSSFSAATGPSWAAQSTIIAALLSPRSTPHDRILIFSILFTRTLCALACASSREARLESRLTLNLARMPPTRCHSLTKNGQHRFGGSASSGGTILGLMKRLGFPAGISNGSLIFQPNQTTFSHVITYFPHYDSELLEFGDHTFRLGFGSKPILGARSRESLKSV